MIFEFEDYFNTILSIITKFENLMLNRLPWKPCGRGNSLKRGLGLSVAKKGGSRYFDTFTKLLGSYNLPPKL